MKNVEETKKSDFEECFEKGHDLAFDDEEEVDGKQWSYCKRCGDWFEKEEQE